MYYSIIIDLSYCPICLFYRRTTVRHRTWDIRGGAKSTQKFRIHFRGDTMLQGSWERNQRGDFRTHGGMSAKSIPNSGTSRRKTQTILWIFLGTRYASNITLTISFFINNDVSLCFLEPRYRREYWKNFNLYPRNTFSYICGINF